MDFLVEHMNDLQNWLIDSQGNKEFLKFIGDLNIRETDLNGNTLLHIVLLNLEVNEMVVQKLLDMGALVNARNYLGQTPLHYALLHKNCEISIVRLLVDKGADVKQLDSSRQDSLIYALKNAVCPGDVIQFLIERGADIHNKNKYEFSVIDLALRFNQKPFEIVKLLIEKGVNVYAVNKRGQSPLHTASACNLKDVVKFLLTKPKIAANLSDKNRCTPLHEALENPRIDPEIIKMLLKAGANVLKKNKHGEHAVHVAAITCNPIVIKLLLDDGARVNVLDKLHHSPLYFAVNCCASFNRPATKMLLDAGALIFEDHPMKRYFPPEGWPFNNISCLFDAVRIYTKERNEKRMQQVQLLLKYALLEKPRLDFQLFDVDELTRIALLDFGEKCLQELQTVCSEPNVTLAQYILRARLREEEECLTEEILEILSANAYPLYKEVVLGLVRREDLKEAFMQYSVCTVLEKNPEEREVLDYDTLCCVMMYLPDDELLNMLMAVYNPKRAVAPSIYSSISNDALLDEIETESGRFFKRARIN